MQPTEMDILDLYVMMVGDKMKLMLFAGKHINENRTYILFVFDQRIFIFRQLGYSSGNVHTGSYYGSVQTSDFAMDNVVCSGTELYLQDCEYSTTDNCDIYDGAGVYCN